MANRRSTLIGHNNYEEFLNLFEGEDETMMDCEDVASTVKSTITEKQDESLQRVVKMWAELGLPPAALNDRTAEIIGLVSEMWDHVVSQEEESLAKAIKYKDERYAQINEMLSALHLPPYVMPTDYSLFATGKLLLAKFDELKKVKDERMDKLSSLLEKRDRLCDSIGEKPEFLKLMTTIPAEHEIAELQSYVSKLQSDKNKRMNQFITIKSDIVNLMAELGLSANGKFEISAVSNDADQFILSKENIKKLVDWQQKLEKTNEANKAKKAAMIERLNYLWTKLEIDESECEDILQHYPINSQQVLDSLKTEQIDKYEAIRKERLGEFIEKLVPEVEHWWERCCVSEDDQNAFLEQIKDLPEASEERLDAWEKELADKKAFYSERQAAFEDVETWKSAWEEFLQIEIGEKDPARLNNRRIPSTVIMKEQQQKRKLEAQIKKHEKALSMLSDKYVNEGKPFLVGGLILKDFIHSKRTEYDEMKENEKQCKKLQKNALMAAEMQGLKTGSASKYVMPPARKTPVKRGGGNSGVTSPSSPSKLRRINGIGSNTKRPGPPGPSSKPSTITKPPRNLTSKFSKATLPLASQGPTGSQQSVLSVNEEEFQAMLKNGSEQDDYKNSTFFVQSSPVKHCRPIMQPAQDDFHIMGKNVTTRGKRGVGLGAFGKKRLSRSCNDLAVAFKGLSTANLAHGGVCYSVPASPLKRTAKSPLKPIIKKAETRRPFRC